MPKLFTSLQGSYKELGEIQKNLRYLFLMVIEDINGFKY